MLLTNRYGDVILPSTLQVDEFDAIFSRVSKYTNNEKSKIAEQMAAIEAQSVSKDQSKQNGEPAENSQNGDVKTNCESKTNGDTKTGGSVSDTASEKDSQKSNTKVQAPRKEPEKKENQLLKALREKLSQLPEPELLQTWYRLDENSIPPMYRLQPIR